MVHFPEINQAPSPYSMLPYICRVATPKLVPRNWLRYLQTTLVMGGGGIGFRSYMRYCRTFHGYIWYFKWHICIKNRAFSEILGRIRDLYAIKDKHSYIRVAFKELHSEKRPPEDNTQNYIRIIKFRKIIFIFLA